MKLKLAITFAFVSCKSFVYCGVSDSSHTSKISHRFQILIGNFIGESFVSANANTSKYYYYAPPGQINYGTNGGGTGFSKPEFIPLYSYSFGFNYKVDLSKHIGLSTGLDYFTYGYIAEGNEGCVECSDPFFPSYKRIIFTSSLQLPLQLLVYKNCKHGRIVFSVGPDFYLPINTFGKGIFNTDYSFPGTTEIHYHVNGTDFFTGGSAGLSAGIGYEKTISKKLAIEFLPDFHILNLVPFDFEGEGKGIYQNYIFNTTLGLSTYLTFTK